MKEPTVWVRTHCNHWTALVSLNEDGLYSAGAHEGGISGVHSASRMIDRLDHAQQIADGDVPSHNCATCPAWTAMIPVD
jgi:hypothetical protein